jgi:GPI-anchor transamidase subunit GAA1
VISISAPKLPRWRSSVSSWLCYISPQTTNQAAGSLRSTRLLKFLPIISSLCIIVGVAWLLLLPLDDYSRRTYISENALLPGQVHTYFGGSEQDVFRAYRNDVVSLGKNATADGSGLMAERIGEVFAANGLKVGRQRFEYKAAGGEYKGENVYAVLQAPRGDATEALVLCAGWINMEGKLNESGVALVLALARYLRSRCLSVLVEVEKMVLMV